MEIIAKTKDGCLIQASDTEVKEILLSISGASPEELIIGQKIPAIDYATTITKIKALGEDYNYEVMLEKIDCFNDIINDLKLSIQNVASIDM